MNGREIDQRHPAVSLHNPELGVFTLVNGSRPFAYQCLEEGYLCDMSQESKS
jgi:hypothetical protein